MRRSIFSLLAALALLAGLLPAAGAIPPVSRPLMEGVDVSVWQGDIQFDAVKQAGIEIVYIRSGYGLTRDRFLEQHYQGARTAGLKLGFYHYLTAETAAEAREQARFFADSIRGLDYDCRPVMDYESFHGMDRSQVSAVAAAFLEELEALTGQTPMVYCDAYHASQVFDQSVARWPLWAAEYGPDEPAVTANWTAWTGFQYTSEGSVPGITGRVDRDLFTPAVLLGHAGTAPAPEQAVYTVQPGDTLWAIARRFGVTVDAIVRANGISDPDLIYPGQQLLLPRAQAVYTVQPGDTLWAIALRYHTTVAELARLNRISDPSLIYPGQVLSLPN